MRIFRTSCYTVLVLAGAAAPTGAGAQTAHNSPHERQLQQEIQNCAQRVNCAESPDKRCLEQEALCKKLVQAEDYEHALKVASAIHMTDGANAERRAAHHFLVARIHAMRMEASSSPNEMERNRQLALQTAQEVLNQGYPKAWRVGEAASNLVQDLNDPRKLALTQAKISKRQHGGIDPRLVQTAAAQSAFFKSHVPSTLGKSGLNRATNTPARDALASKLARSQGVKITNSSGSPNNLTRASYSNSGAKISDSKGSVVRGGSLKGPILISGTTVRRVSSGAALTQQDTSSAGASSRSGIGAPSAARGSKTGSPSSTTSTKRPRA